jgi:hypothetical protein
MVRSLIYRILFIAALVAAMSFSPPGNARLIIQFENYAGDNPLALDSVSYKNTFNQSYKVTMFKYYVGNFHLMNNKGKEFVSNGYFLISQEDKNSMQISINNIPIGEYTAVDFTLGIDSIDNCSGAQSGALDPINGMFWTWNSGYIFLKMEGISSASNSTGKRLEFHIGGYKEPNNCIKKINLKISYGLKIQENEDGNLGIKADLSRLFIGPYPVDFSKLSSVTDFHNAKAIADNYSNMFSIVKWQ